MPVNIDKKIGLWLRNIPYIWKKRVIKNGRKSTWKDYSRIYIGLPEQPTKKVGGKKYFKEITEITNDKRILNYFRFDNFIRNTKDIKKLRINGKRLYLPEHLLLDIKKKKSYSIYDYLNIKNTGIINLNERLVDSSYKDIVSIAEPPVSDEDVKLDGQISRSLYNALFLFDLTRRYKNVCVPTREKLKLKNLENIQSYHGIRVKLAACSVVDTIIFEDYVQNFNKCLKGKKRFICVTVHLEGAEGTSHANIIIFDKKTKEAEFYDPWGSTLCGKEAVDQIVSDVKDILQLSDEWKIVHSLEFCPNMAFQKLAVRGSRFGFEDDYAGYCAVWRLWLLENRLKNPDASREELIKLSHSELARKYGNYRIFIRKYAQNIEKIGKIIRKQLKLEYKTPVVEKGKKIKIKLSDKDIKKLEKFLKKKL